MQDDSQPASTSATKSLTPQRKHRKLLKDGSGTAVWPEAIEALFVQGLREYWDSPWATYSRGRSRWRNQFLVDYLQNLGITRSKKQVASHIQVLRNMWKGEPEYHLVAGGEDGFHDDPHPPPVKQEHHPTLLTIDHDDCDSASSLSNSPPDFLSDFPPSPASSPMFPTLSYSPSSPLSSIPDIDSPPHPFSTLPYNPAAALAYPPLQKPYPAPPAPLPNRLTSFVLLADGMTALTINLDRLAPPAPLPARTPPLALRMRLAIPPLDAPRSPPNLHGFFTTVRLAGVWVSAGRCATRVYAGGVCIAADEGALLASTIELGSVVAALPESGLSRCRWFDPQVQTTITQQIVVDGATLLFVVYDLDRRSGGLLPSAELLAFQKHTSAVANPPPPPAASPPYAHPLYAPPSTYTPSLSAALTPVRTS